MEVKSYHVSSFLSDLELVLRRLSENPSRVVELRRIGQGVVVSEGNGGIRVAKRSFAPVGAVGDEAVVDGREGGEGERRKDVQREKKERQYQVSVAKLHQRERERVL